jgi:hypothetical protein
MHQCIWAKTSLGGTIANHFKKWLKNQKWPNHFPRPFTLNNYKFIFSHAYQLHALIYDLNFILEFKKLQIVKKLCYQLKMPP